MTIGKGDYLSGDVLPDDGSTIVIRNSIMTFSTKYLPNTNRFITLFKDTQRTERMSDIKFVEYTNSTNVKKEIARQFAIIDDYNSWIHDCLYDNGLTVTVSRCTSSGQYIGATSDAGIATYLQLQIDWQYSYQKTTFTATNTYFGSNTTITLSNVLRTNTLNHKLEYSFSGHEDQKTSDTYDVGVITDGMAINHLINTTYLSYVPSSKTINLKITLSTYEGTSLVGTDQHEIVVTVGDQHKPTVDDIAIQRTYKTNEVQTAISSWNEYVQTYTGANITVTSTAQENTQIDYYEITFDGTKYKSQTGSVNVGLFSSNGEKQIKVKVVDKRGFVSDESTTSITVREYSAPQIHVTERPQRCLSSGTIDSQGTYGKGSFVGTINSCNGKNIMTLQIGCATTKTATTVTILQNDIVSGQSYIFGGSFSPDVTYYIYYIVKDALTTVVQVNELSTSQYAIHVKKGGNGVAFGKVSQKDNAVQINPNWDFYYQGNKVTFPSYKMCCGKISVYSGGATTYDVNYSSAGFTSVPSVVCSVSTTASTASEITMYVINKTTANCKIQLKSTPTSSVDIDWIAMGT